LQSSNEFLSKNTRRFVAARIVFNLAFVILVFTSVIPNCFVPEDASIPRHFAWIGLIPPFSPPLEIKQGRNRQWSKFALTNVGQMTEAMHLITYGEK
jgi:hypothetical protein